MWERGRADSDFCHVRVGLGRQRSAAAPTAPDLGPIDQLEPVGAMALRDFVRAHSVVRDVPIALALTRFSTVTVEGDEQCARALMRAMVCQLAVLHGPECLAITAIVGESAAAEWDWLKWLPHPQPPGNAGAHTVIVVDGGDASAVDRRDVTMLVRGAAAWPPCLRLDVSARRARGDRRRARGVRAAGCDDGRAGRSVCASARAVPAGSRRPCAFVTRNRLASAGAPRDGLATASGAQQTSRRDRRCDGRLASRTGPERGRRARHGPARALCRSHRCRKVGVLAYADAGTDRHPRPGDTQPHPDRLQRWCNVFGLRSRPACVCGDHQPLRRGASCRSHERRVRRRDESASGVVAVSRELLERGRLRAGAGGRCSTRAVADIAGDRRRVLRTAQPASRLRRGVRRDGPAGPVAADSPTAGDAAPRRGQAARSGLSSCRTGSA